MQVNKFFIIVLLIALIFCGIASLKEGCANILLFAGLFYIIGIGIVYLEKSSDFEKTFLKNIFTYGYVIRILAAVIIYYLLLEVKGYPFIGIISEEGGQILGSDDFAYEMTGRFISESLINHEGIPQFFGSSQPAYYIVNGFLHYIAHFIGVSHVLVPRIFNCLIGALIPIYVFKISFRIFNINVAKTAAWISLLFPNFIYFSSIQLKDIIIAFLFVFTVSYVLEYLYTNKLSKFFVATISVILLSFFRHIYAVELAAVIIITLFIFAFPFNKTKIGIIINNFKHTVLLVIILSALIFFGVKGQLSNIINPTPLSISEIIEIQNIESIYTFMGTTETADSLTFYFYEKMSLPVRAVIFPIFLLITPYPPWRAFITDDPLSIITFLNGLFWLSILPFLVFGFIFTIRKKTLIGFPLVAIFMVVLTTIAISYFQERYRLPVMPFALILSTAGIYHSFKYSWSKIYYIWFHFLLLMGYLLMKYHFISIGIFIILLFGFIIYPILAFRRKGYEI